MTSLAIVTGAAGGIGSAIVRRLASDGFHVAIVDRDGERLDSLATQLRSEGISSIETYVCDLTSHEDLDELVGGRSRVAALVNNAGLFDESRLLDLVPDDFRRMYELNLIAAAELTRRIAPLMPRGGKIVNIASRAYLGARNHAHYVAAKAALVGYTRASAIELAAHGILVNAVAPGLVDTPLLRALSPERLQAQLALQPTGEAGRPEDIANAVSFLADPKMSFITGQVLLVDGGKSLGGLGAG